MGNGGATSQKLESATQIDPLAPTIRVKKARGRLLPHVDAYYLYKCNAEDLRSVERVDLGQIRFVISGEGEMHFPDGHVEKTKPIMVSGPSTAAASYHMRGPVTVFGVTLRAIGWKALIGIPAHKVTDHLIDGSKLFCERAQEALRHLRTVTEIEDMIAAVAPLLIMRQEEVEPVPVAHFPFLRAVREWAAIEGAPIDHLYARIKETNGPGERQVQRLCREYFGAPPAQLKRKFRAIRAAMKLYQGAPLAEVIEPFADQSHMINDVKHYTGHTPTSLRSGLDPVLPVTLDNENFHFLPDVIPESVDEWPRGAHLQSE